jgi:steroid delta-isomerase-like uncharacterized protein
MACKNGPGKETALLYVARDSTVMGNVHAYIDSLWNRQDTTFLKNLSSEHFIRNLNGIEVANTPREMQAHLNVFFTAFPDLKLRLEQAFVRDGKAFILWSTEGTNTGIFGEMAPTGKKVKINGMSHLYFDEDGKLYGEYVYFNELELLQQLGYTLLPPKLE